jgi:hypothetical protein
MLLLPRSQDNVVGIATDNRLENQEVGIRVLVEPRIFSSPHRPDRLWSSPSLLSNRYQGALFLGVKQLGHEADHSPPTSAKIKKTWIYTSTPPHTFMA